MPKVETKTSKVETREGRAVLTKEAEKLAASGRGKDPEKASAQAGRDATGKMEDAAKAYAVRSIRGAARTLSAFRRWEHMEPPPMPDLDIPPPPQLLPQSPLEPLPELEGRSPPALDGTVLGPHEPIAEGNRLFQPPAASQTPAIQGTEPPPISPASNGMKTLEQAKKNLQIQEAVKSRDASSLFHAPGAGTEHTEAAEPIRGKSPTASENQVELHPFGAESARALNQSPSPEQRKHSRAKRRRQETRRGPIDSVNPAQKGAGLSFDTPCPTAPNGGITANSPQLARVKKQFQIKRLKERFAKKNHEIGEMNRNSETIQANLFHPPDAVQDTKALPAHTEKSSQNTVSGRTRPGQKEARPTRILQREGRADAVQRPLNTARQRGKALAIRKAQQEAARNTVGKTAAVRKAAAALAKRVFTAVSAGAKALVTALAPVLGALAAVLAVVLIAAAAASSLGSPFGILFANENTDPGTVHISEAVWQLNADFNNYLIALQAPGYDSVKIHGNMADWPEVLAVFAVKTAGTTNVEAMDVITMDEARVALLSTVFWDMNPVRTEIGRIYHPPTDEDGSGWTETILNIYIMGKTAAEMEEIYGFTPDQRAMLEELLTDYRELLIELTQDLSIPSGDASGAVEALPEELSPKRRAAVEKALSLVGKVGYFWGGKSYVTGWDDRWGTPTLVTAAGSSTTGKYIPFGLDCSGFLDWSFRNAGLPSAGHWYLETNLTEITWAEAQPGDVVLYPDDSHVGLVVGRDGSGRVLAVHCSFSLNTVAISDAQAFGFTKVGTPAIYDQ